MSSAAIAYPDFLDRLRAAPGLKSAGALEAGLTILALFLFSQGLLGPLLADESDPESSAILRFIWLPVYAVTILLMLARPAASVRVLWQNMIVLAFIGLVMISVSWSVAPDVTLRRGFALAMTTLFGLWLASRWSWAALIAIVAGTYIIMAVLSAMMALAVPSLGVDQAVHAGAWKGIWWEKNTLGAMMAYGAVATLAASLIQPQHRWAWRLAALFCAALVVLSTSKTALLAMSLGVGGIIGIALCRTGFVLAAITLFIGLTGGILAALILTIAPLEALELLGRDATLTGRTDIWAVLVDQIRAAPWTGFGYKAYWAAENGPVFWVRQATAWDVPTAHNGWIELGLAVGLPGMALMAIYYLRALFSALGRVFSGPEAYWALPVVAMTGLISISESNLAQQNSLSWVLLVAIAAKLAAGRVRG